jgi:hypothetical protein
MGMFDGDTTYRFCRKENETVQHIICCCEALARQRYVFGNPLVETKDTSTASVSDLCLFIRGTGLLNLLNKPKAEVHSRHKLTGPREEEEDIGMNKQCNHILNLPRNRIIIHCTDLAENIDQCPIVKKATTTSRYEYVRQSVKQ